MKSATDILKVSLAMLVIGFFIASCGQGEDIILIDDPIDEFPDTIIIVDDRGEMVIHHPDGDTLTMQGHGSLVSYYDSLGSDLIVISNYEHECYFIIDSLTTDSDEFYFQIFREPQIGYQAFGWINTVDAQGIPTVALMIPDFPFIDTETGEYRELSTEIYIDELTDEFVRGSIEGEFIILVDPEENAAFSIGEFRFDFGVPFDIDCE